ncbi:MAG: hypothetical protein J7K98_02790 [Candidatus Aenigmarchaeota archaeon]|nr:hypothetical protein [Candidatus Aenigmarchaeota archaeon]
MNISKGGYYSRKVGFSENIGFLYDSGDSGYWDREQNVELKGTVKIKVKTIDDFDGMPINNSLICVVFAGDDCEYTSVTDYTGWAEVYVRGGQPYFLKISSLGYVSKRYPDSGNVDGSLTTTINLTAHSEVYVYDVYATDYYKPIPNANVSLYYYYNQTEFEYTLTQTNVYVNVVCNYTQRDGIEVKLGSWSKTTSGGSKVVVFERVPVGSYYLTVNGSNVGCTAFTTTVSIPTGGKDYIFNNYLASRILKVKVIDPKGDAISGATVTIGSKTASEVSPGIYVFNYMVPGSYTVTASAPGYYQNSSVYNVGLNAVYDYTSQPILLLPHPGNLTVYVENFTNYGISGINVTVYNSTGSKTVFTEDGWGNFSDVVGFVNVVADGRNVGYWKNETSVYIEPESVTGVEFKLLGTNLTIVVEDNESNRVSNANVTFYNMTTRQIATNGRGGKLTGLTDSNGAMSFSFVKKGNYNVTIQKDGYAYFSTTLNLGWEDSNIKEVVYKLNSTYVDVTVTDCSTGDKLEGVKVTLKGLGSISYEETQITGVEGNVSFDSGLSAGNYNLTVNGTGIGYNLTFKTINVVSQNNNPQSICLSPITLTVFVNDTKGEKVLDGVVLKLNQTSFKNETFDGVTKFFKVPFGSYRLIVNGTGKGYGVNITDITVDEYEKEVFVLLGVTKLTVHVYNETGNVSGAVVSLRNVSTGEIESNAKGELLNGTTDSNGNITFSYVMLGTYNVTVKKNSTFVNYTTYEINLSNAGRNNYLEIDPSQPETVTCAETPNYNLTFTVKDEKGTSISGVVVTIENPSNNNCVVASNLTNSSGQVTLGVEGNKIYVFVIDGEAVGYGKYSEYEYVGTKKKIVNSGYTDESGKVVLQVNGKIAYYVSVSDARGYGNYDDFNNSLVRNGTYDDAISDKNPYVKSSIKIGLEGTTFLYGYVKDKNFYQPQQLSYEPVSDATIILYPNLDCTGNPRYQTTSNISGAYGIRISAIRLGGSTVQSYCIKVVANGFEDYTENSVKFDENSSVMKVIGMEGEGEVAGYVKKILTGEPLANVTVELRSYSCYYHNSFCPAYRTATDENGYFALKVTTRDEYKPYSVYLTRVNFVNYNENYNIVPDMTNLSYSMMPASTAVLKLEVKGSDGFNLTRNVTVEWNGQKLGEENQDCIFENNNRLACLIYSSPDGTLRVDGSSLGYGVYEDTKNYQTGNEYEENIVLNVTVVNMTLMDDEGNLLDGVTVKLYSDEIVNVSSNGNVKLFRVPVGWHTVKFEGNVTRAYVYGTSNIGNIYVDEPGEVNSYTFTFNQTRYLLRIVNESFESMSNITVVMMNTETEESFEGQTNQTGYVLFESIPYGSYNVEFNQTQLLEKGYNPKSVSVYVTRGKDEYSGNNKTIVVENNQLIFNVTNDTNPLQGLNISLYLDGQIASNGFGYKLSGLTNSTGILVFRNVVPSSVKGLYYYVVDGNSTGYGVLNKTIWIATGKNYVSLTLVPATLRVEVKDYYNNTPVDGNVTVYLLNGSVAKTVEGFEMKGETTSGVINFSKVYAGKYNVTFNSTNYTFVSKEVSVNYNVTTVTLIVKQLSKIYSTTTTTTVPSQNQTENQTTTTTTTVSTTSSTTTIASSGGGGGSKTYRGEASGGEVVIEGFEKETWYKLTEWMNKEYAKKSVNETLSLVKKLGEVLGMTQDNMASGAENFAEVAKDFEVRRRVKVSKDESSMDVYVAYHGSSTLIDFVMYDVIPKSVTRYASDVEVETSEGVSVELVEFDPSFMFVWSRMEPEKVYRIRYVFKKKLAEDVLDQFSVPIFLTAGVCGNGACEFGENSNNCCMDCGCPDGYECKENTCVAVGEVTPVCGNGLCEEGENSNNCCIDCGCPTGYECKDGVCTKRGMSYLYLVVFGIVVLLFILVLLLLFRSRKKEEKFEKRLEEELPPETITIVKQPVYRPYRKDFEYKPYKKKEVKLEYVDKELRYIKDKISELKEKLKKFKK